MPRHTIRLPIRRRPRSRASRCPSASSIGAIADEPIADIEYVDGHRMWAKEYCHNQSADGGMGKTYLMAQKAVAQTGNIPFLGLPILQGGFVFLSAEERIHIMRQRIRAISEAEGRDVRDLQGLLLVDLSKLDLRGGTMPWLLVEIAGPAN